VKDGSTEQDLLEGVGTTMEDLVGTYSKKQDDSDINSYINEPT
jgi:hypothetical protein